MAYVRSPGATVSEQRLAKMAEHTFLDLWSWPNVFGEPGKELCDLLVACGDDVLIFSDKDIKWPDGDLPIAWKRWYRRAIGKSADQIRGAARWLDSHPESVFIDGKCKQRVPLNLPPKDRRRVHGICVVVGCEEAASRYFNDPDGSFMIYPHLRGEEAHLNVDSAGGMPFCIGDVDPDGPFVHVFNQMTLAVVMSELDTITDFTAYLNARAMFLRADILQHSPSEAELLAHYLLTFKKGRNAFPTRSDVGAPANAMLNFVQGEYAYLVRSEEYKQRRAADRESYAWDRLIGLFTESVLGERQYRILDTDPTFELAENALRIMALEPRAVRRALGDSLSGAVVEMDRQKVERFARVVRIEHDNTRTGLAYVFVVLKGRSHADREEYRRTRATTLQTYVMSVMHDDRTLTRCVGIAVGARSDDGSSEDLIALPQQDWRPDMVEALRNARQQLEVMIEPHKLVVRRDFGPQAKAKQNYPGTSRKERRAQLSDARRQLKIRRE